MKISPIIYNLYIPKPLQSIQKSTFISFRASPTEDSFEVSKSNAPSYLSQATDINGIHCPRCGTAMLTEKEFQTILDKASEVETASDFSELVNEYKDYVPSGMHKILRRHGTIDNDFKQYFNKLNKGAYLKHKDAVEKANNYLLKFSKSQSQENQEEIQQFVIEIKPTISSYNYNKKLIPLLKNCKMNQKDYIELLNNTVLSLNKSSDYLYVFKIPELEQKSPSEIAQIMAGRIFSKSLVNHVKISNIYDLDNPNNEILTCHSCTKTSGKTFLNPTDLENPELKENIIKYLHDISIKLGHRNLETNSSYIYYLTNFINRISKHEITFNDDEIKIIKKLNLIASRHNEFEPISQTKTDIPCAGCGSTLLPHDIKLKIEHELTQRSTIKGYIGILKEYDKYIGEYARENADLLIKLAAENPGISKLELVELVQYHADKNAEKEALNAFKDFTKARNYILQTRPLAEVENYDKIAKAIFEYLANGKLKKDFNYMNFVSEGLKDFDFNKDMPVFLYTFLNKIKIICNKNTLVKYNEQDMQKDKDPLQTIIYKMFNSDLATADHLVAKKKGGDADRNNIIGLCKFCNKIIKGGKQIFPWLVQNPKTIINLPLQLQTINDMAKRGELEDYDDWAQNIIELVKEETRGKFDFSDSI